MQKKKEDIANEYLNLYLDAVKPEARLDIERAIIGCMFQHSSCIKDTFELLPEMFTDTKCREIFSSVCHLYENRCPIDVQTVVADLLHRNVTVSNEEMMVFITDNQPSYAANMTPYVKLLRLSFLQRQFYQMMCLAPLALRKDAHIAIYEEMIKPLLIPLYKALFDTYDRPKFVPHWLTNGTATYKVLKNKYGPGGYVWVDDKPYPEWKLLASGFQKIYNFNEPSD